MMPQKWCVQIKEFCRFSCVVLVYWCPGDVLSCVESLINISLAFPKWNIQHNLSVWVIMFSQKSLGVLMSTWPFKRNFMETQKDSIFPKFSSIKLSSLISWSNCCCFLLLIWVMYVCKYASSANVDSIQLMSKYTFHD